MTKALLILLSLTAFNSAFAGTLSCSISKNFFENEKPLIQTSFAENDEEENSEVYKLTYDNAVKAYVSYLPFQHGSHLYIESLNKKIGASSGFNNEANSMSLNLKVNGTTYILSCIKIVHY